MRKLHLEIEALQVDSFEPAPADGDAAGTVHAHGTHPAGCFATETCGWYGTCQASCVATCAAPGCDPEDTLWLTCMAGCSWTGGDAVCLDLPDDTL